MQIPNVNNALSQQTVHAEEENSSNLLLPLSLGYSPLVYSLLEICDQLSARFIT